MVITKAELADWNSHPVTKEIFREIEAAKIEIMYRNKVEATADETAMRAAEDKGIVQGMECIQDAFGFIEEYMEEEE